MDEIKLEKEEITIPVLKAQIVKMTEMYDDLLTKYRDEIAKSTMIESAYKTLIDYLKSQGVKFGDEPITTETKSAECSCGKEGCNCNHDHK